MVNTMTRNRNKINQAAISVRKQTITQATAGEMTALTMMGGGGTDKRVHRNLVDPYFFRGAGR